MKAIKNLCLFCFLIFGILMQSEIFQDQLWNFSTAYFTSSRYEVASEDMSQFLKIEEYVLSGDTSSKNIFFWLKLIIMILLFQYIRYIDGIYICILFIWIFYIYNSGKTIAQIHVMSDHDYSNAFFI